MSVHHRFSPGKVPLGTVFVLAALAFISPPIGKVSVLDSECRDGYQLTLADVDRDGSSDILTLGDVISWLRFPTWEKHLISGTPSARNIDLAPHDIDGDGRLDLAAASDFSMDYRPGDGLVQWFRRSDDATAPWQGFPIDREPTSHRLRWADIEGGGRKLLVVAPIMGPGTQAPSYDQTGAKLALYRIPADPVRDPWPKLVFEDSLPVVHGLLVFDWDADGRDEILTASRQGVHLFRFQGSGTGLRWTRDLLCTGDQESEPARGSSEVGVGRLRSGGRFIATIEPWHGRKVVVYRPAEPGRPWLRQVIDESFDEGHALQVFDADGDGSDEIFAGFRGRQSGVVRYAASTDDGSGWVRTVMDDGGVSCQGLAGYVAPDGSIGLLAIGGRTHNVVLFGSK